MDSELEVYEFMHIDRQNKGGGGVGIYVDTILDFSLLDNMLTVINNVLECISIEIYREKHKPVIFSCICRTPGSSIEQFKD